jgi:hypothetical protein
MAGNFMLTYRTWPLSGAGLAILFCLLLGCATPPERIVATAVPDEIYAGHSCSQLKVDRAEAALAISTLSQQQASAVTGDTVGVLMVGLPLSSMGGNDVGAKLGEMKGRLVAIDTVIAEKKCLAT